MPYATPQQLIDMLGHREATALSDRSGTGAPDVAALAKVLADAEQEINAYVGRRYRLPLMTTGGVPAAAPSVLTRMAIDVARYRSTGTEIMETETIRTRFKDALRQLEQIAAGTMSLGDLQLAASGGSAAVAGTRAARTATKSFGDLSRVL